MKSTDQVKARATKLSDVLSAMGHDLKHPDSLDIISKLDGDLDRNTNASTISKEREIAEQFLTEMLDAKTELNYKKFISRMDKEVLEQFTKKRFLRAMRNLREDLGPYVSRKYMGSVNGSHYSEPVEKYPGKTRHIWRGVFENHEVFITVGIFFRNGIPHVHGINFR